MCFLPLRLHRPSCLHHRTPCILPLEQTSWWHLQLLQPLRPQTPLLHHYPEVQHSPPRTTAPPPSGAWTSRLRCAHLPLPCLRAEEGMLRMWTRKKAPWSRRLEKKTTWTTLDCGPVEERRLETMRRLLLIAAGGRETDGCYDYWYCGDDGYEVGLCCGETPSDSVWKRGTKNKKRRFCHGTPTTQFTDNHNEMQSIYLTLTS